MNKRARQIYIRSDITSVAVFTEYLLRDRYSLFIDFCFLFCIKLCVV